MNAFTTPLLVPLEPPSPLVPLEPPSPPLLELDELLELELLDPPLVLEPGSPVPAWRSV